MFAGAPGPVSRQQKIKGVVRYMKGKSVKQLTAEGKRRALRIRKLEANSKRKRSLLPERRRNC